MTRTYSLIDYFRAFHSYSKKHELRAGARSLYFGLLGEFNAGRWPGELCFSDSEMAALSGVQKRETIRDAKNLLKTTSWIDFHIGKNRKSVYKLLPDNVAKFVQNGQLENASSPKTDNLQTKFTENGQLESSSSYFSDNLPDNLPDNLGDNLPDNQADNLGGFPMERTRVDSRQEDNRQSSLNRASACEDVDELIKAWKAAGGTKLNQLILSKFAVLLKTHTLAEMKSAIERAGLDKNGSYDFAYKFFLSKLNAKNDVKEGDTSGDDDVEEHDPRDVWEFSNW